MRFRLDYLCVLRNIFFVSEGHDIGDWAIRYEIRSIEPYWRLIIEGTSELFLRGFRMDIWIRYFRSV